MRKRCYFFAVVLLLSVISPISAQETAAVRLAEEFFQTFPDKNFEKMQTLWSEKSPERERFLKQFRFSLTDTENISFRDFSVRGSAFEGDKLTLQISLTMDATDSKTKRQKWNFGKWNRVLRLVKENESWKVWDCKFAEEEFAVRLANAANEAEQDALLAENPYLLNRFLRRAIIDLSRSLRRQGQFGKVVFLAEMFERLAQKTGEEIWLTRALFIRGALFYHLGEQNQAGEFFLKGEKISQKLNDEEGLVLVWHSLGLLRAIQASPEPSYYPQTAELAQKIGDMQTFLRVRNNQGAEFFNEASASVWTHQANLFKVKLPEKPLRQALIYFQEIADIYDMMGDSSGKNIAIANIGEAYRYLGEYENALKIYDEAIALAEKRGDLSLKDGILTSVCYVYLGQKRYVEAKELIEKMLAPGNPNFFAKEYYDREIIAAKIYQNLGENDKAEKYFLEVIDRYENQRKSITNTLLRQRFLHYRVFPYYEMAVLKAEQNRAEEALNYSEMIKARVLFDVVRSGAKFSEKSLTEAERDELQKLKNAIESLNRQIINERVKSKQDEAKLKKLNENLAQARSDLEKYQIYLGTIHPELGLQRGEIPLLNLAEIENLLPDEKTAIIEYAVTDEKILAFILTKKEKADLQVYQLPIARRELAPKVRGFWELISAKNLDYKEKSQELYAMLIKPLEKHLQGRENLIVVPDGVLWELPFQALTKNGKNFLIENFAISYTPSLSVLREMQKAKTSSSSNNFLAFGNPKLERQSYVSGGNANRNYKFEPLPEAEKEINRIASFYGRNQSLLFVGNKASENSFKTQAENYDILHLATHGVADNEFPMFSFLVLAAEKNGKEDGILEAWEVMQLNLRAEMAILSACETGRGKLGEGEGIIGLSWAFFVAGVPTTVVSSWNVRSAETADLMIEFHRNLRLKKSKPKALQAAMVSVLKNRKYNHPYFWAGFVLIGKN